MPWRKARRGLRRRPRCVWRTGRAGPGALISHRHRCIYVKVPKCASTAVLDWFLAHGGGYHSFRPYWYGGLLSERIQGVARTLDLYPGYASFTFLRNPYARFVSLHRYLGRLAAAEPPGGPPHPADYGTLGEFAELCREVLGEFGPLWGREARAFFQAHGGRAYGPRRIRLGQLGFVTGHARPQTHFLPDRNPGRLFGVARTGDAPLAFIGGVETMAADWRRLADMLDLPAAALPARNAAGPGARDGGYAAHYDGATRRLVEEIYAADLEFTGCGFEHGRLAVAVAARPVAAPPARRRPAGRRLARARHRLLGLGTGVGDRVLRKAGLRRILRPLKRLGGTIR